MGAYFRDRGRDLTDIVDVKAGLGFGVGIKADVTAYLGTGAGLGVLGPCGKKFGREWVGDTLGAFWHFIVAGFDGGKSEGPATNFHAFGLNLPELKRPVTPGKFHVGGEVLLPAFDVGLYLNLGELADFLSGLFGLDISADDEPIPEEAKAVKATEGER